MRRTWLIGLLAVVACSHAPAVLPRAVQAIGLAPVQLPLVWEIQAETAAAEGFGAESRLRVHDYRMADFLEERGIRHRV